MNMDPKVQRIINWRKYLTTLDDNEFFDIIRFYLGEVKTPYNKQSLIEDLSVFLRKEENKQVIVKLLSSIDLKILSAVKYISGATAAKLESFFAQSEFASDFSAHMENVFQRLLIFSYVKEEHEKAVLFINPLLEDCLENVLSMDILLPSYPKMMNLGGVRPRILDVQHIAALISYTIKNSDICKGDGYFKKRSSEEIDTIMGSVESMELLFDALRNIGVIIEAQKGFCIDWKKFEAFGELEEVTQYVYICASTFAHLSRSSLWSNAQLLFDVLCSLGSNAYTMDSIAKMAVLIQQAGDTMNSRSSVRFQSILSGSRTPSSGENSPSITEAMLDAAVEFGILEESGEDEEGHKLYAVNDNFIEKAQSVTGSSFASRHSFSERKKDALSIDAGFAVTVLPCLTLSDYVPLLKFLDIVKCDMAMSFEISKSSVMRAFDLGIKPENIEQVISTYSSYAIPQNLTVSISEWYASYTSAAFFKGYVLKVNAENEIRVKNNPYLSSHIVEELAPGVYLMDFIYDEDAAEAIRKSKLDFIGKIRVIEEQPESVRFLSINPHAVIDDCVSAKSVSASGKNFAVADASEQEKFLQSMIQKVRDMDITLDQRDGLINRINRRLIVNEDQLRPESVRFEQLEATGMDYQGKLHVIESAIQAKCLIRIDSGNLQESYTGDPISLVKEVGDADFVLQLESGEQKTFSVSKASYVKKISRPLTF